MKRAAKSFIKPYGLLGYAQRSVVFLAAQIATHTLKALLRSHTKVAHILAV